jgi:2-iminoacetate synthase
MNNKSERLTADFINEDKIHAILESTKNVSREELEAIIEKAEKAAGLSPEEVAKLLNSDDPAIVNRIFKAAHHIKEKIYGKRVVIFAGVHTVVADV